MACMPSPRLPSPFAAQADPNPNKSPCKKPNFFAPSTPSSVLQPLKGSATPAPRFSLLTLCRCRNPNSDSQPLPGGESGRSGWDALLQDAVRSAVKRWDDYVGSYWNPSSKGGPLTNVVADDGHGEEEVNNVEEEVDWDWERWKQHFTEVEEEERIVAVLKSQLTDAVAREDYEDAVKLKLAIATTSKNDTVGTAISDLDRAIEEERYCDAVFIRDYAGAGLVGWWAGISEDAADPYGLIVRISAEHGRYVARSYSSRQLATGRAGLPLFEIFFTESDGEYKKQAVYLKWNSVHSGDFPKKSAKKSDSSSLNPSDGSAEGRNDKFTEDVKAVEEGDDSDVAGLAGIQNMFQDVIPGIKFKFSKVVSLRKVDRDLIAKVVEQIIDEEDEGNDEDVESIEADDIVTESDIEEIEMDAGDAASGSIVEPSEAPVKFVIGTIMPNFSADVPPNDKDRVPARMDRRNRMSFSFSIEQDDEQDETDKKGHALRDKFAARPAQRSADVVMYDLAKAVLSKEKIPMKVIRDIGEIISSTINQNHNHHHLSGTTLFNRIEIPTTSDPLSGLYVGAHGMFTSEVLYLKHKFGHWQVDDVTQKHMDLEFYEYVEAFKLTGGVSVPAGQVAFRAKVGKRYQLPHKGIIPEEFGVAARYKGQGRLADPGFKNPRWVDGELVILDGKFVRGGPVIGFVYWASERHFLEFYNRLRLPE